MIATCGSSMKLSMPKPDLQRRFWHRQFDRHLRLVDEIVDAKIFAVGLVLHRQRRVTDRRRKQNECEDVRDIELPHPAIDVAGGGDWPLPLERLSIDGRGSVARYEDEDLGSVGER